MTALVLDADGVVIQTEYFMHEFVREHDVGTDEMLAFFDGPFQDCLVGEADLTNILPPYLDRWGWEGSVDAFLQYWFETEDAISQQVVNAVQRIRADGVPCFVATNQERHRLRFMRDEMGFKDVFDHVFCSAELGVKKPDTAFFLQIDERIAASHDVERVLYWDDERPNVETAREYGWDAHMFSDTSSFLEDLQCEGLLPSKSF